jgi:hypothetical protein
MTLIVEVVSGQHIPRPKNDDDTSDIMDPYVQVRSIILQKAVRYISDPSPLSVSHFR